MIQLKFFKSLLDRITIIVFNQISVIIAYFIILYRLDKINIGLISTYLIIYQIFYIITEWGYTLYGLHYAKSVKKEYLKKLYIYTNISKIFILIFCLIALLLFFYFFPKYLISKFSIIILILIQIISIFNPLWYLQAIFKTKILVIPTAISKFLYIILVFFFVDDQNLDYFFVGQLLSIGIPILFGNLYILKKGFPRLNFNFQEILQLIKKTSGIFFSTIIQNEIFLLWGFFLILFSNPIQLAYFGIVSQILRAGNGFGNVFQEIFLSTKPKFGFGSKIFNQSFLFLINLILILAILGYIFVGGIIIYIFDNKFIEAISAIEIIVIAWFFISFTKIIGYPFANYFSEIRYLNKLSLFIFALNLFLFFISYFMYEINIINISYFYLIVVTLHFLLTFFYIIKKNKIFFF